MADTFSSATKVRTAASSAVRRAQRIYKYVIRCSGRTQSAKYPNRRAQTGMSVRHSCLSTSRTHEHCNTECEDDDVDHGPKDAVGNAFQQALAGKSTDHHTNRGNQ